MKLSIIIPVYNEEKTILSLLERVKKVNIGKIQKEIIIIDDCSIDKTKDLIKNLKDIKILYHKKNLGKGAVIRTGLSVATGDIIIIQDADLEYYPEEYPKLLKPLLENKSKVVYGSRFLNKHKPKYKIYYLGNKFLTFLINLFYNSKITDMETCYKVFKKDVIKNIKLESNDFGIEPEITSKLLKNKYKIYEVPIKYKSRDFKEGKKINWKDGLKAIYYIIKYKLKKWKK